MSWGLFTKQAGTPSTPATNKVKLFFNSLKQLATVDDAAAVRVLASLDGTETLTGKTLTAPTITAPAITGLGSITDQTKIVDDADVTKVLQPSLGGMTAGTILTLASAQASSQTLNLPVIRQAETLAVKPQVAGALVASPTGTTSATLVMMGLAASSASNIITPQVTGRICIMISGVMAQSTTADGAIWEIHTGTGSAPANGAATTGTLAGGQQSMTFLTGVLKVPFCIVAYVTGLTLGTAVWIDLAFARVTGGTATATQVMVSAFEF